MRIVQCSFPVARFAVFPVGDFQGALQFQVAAIGHRPLAQKMREFAVEHETVSAAGVLDRHVDELLADS